MRRSSQQQQQDKDKSIGSSTSTTMGASSKQMRSPLKTKGLEDIYGAAATTKHKPGTVAGAGNRKPEKVQKKVSSISAEKPKAKQSLSPIVAASKASYAEKYGPLNTKLSSTTTTTASTMKKNVYQSPLAKKGVPPKNTSKVIAMSKKKTAVATAATTSTSRSKLGTMTTGQTTAKGKIEPETVPETTPEPTTVISQPQHLEQNEYEDDFEEDYQSDFEEVQSTDEEDFEEGLMQQEIQLPLAPTPTPTPNFSENQISMVVGSPSLELETDDEEEELEESPPAAVEFNDKRRTSTTTSTAPVVSVTLSTVKNFQSRNKVENISSEEMSKFSVVSSQMKPKGKIVLGKSYDRVEKEKRAKRESHLMKMIKLDKVSGFTLNLNGHTDHTFQSLCGPNRSSRETQTKRFSDEESTQTDKIIMCNMWVQKPAMWSTKNPSTDIRIIRMENLGVGTDDLPEKPYYENPSNFLDNQSKSDKLAIVPSWSKVSDFVSRASRKVLYILESQKRLNIPEGKSKNSAIAGGIPEIKMKRGLSVLNKLKMGCIFSDGDFLACSNGHASETDNKKHTSKNLITVWSMKEPSVPMYYLRVWGQVSVIHIDIRGHLIVAGNKDGTVSLWDLDEATHYHTLYQDQYIRTPTIITSCMKIRHVDRIVGLYVAHETIEFSTLLSLDKLGILISWGCMRFKEELTHPEFPVHTSPWSKLNLTILKRINLHDILQLDLFITSFTGWKGRNANKGSLSFAFSTANGFLCLGTLLDSDDDDSSAIDINKNETHGDNLMNTPTPPDLHGQQLKIQFYEEQSKSRLAAMCLSISNFNDIMIAGYVDGKCRVFELYNKKMILEIPCERIPISVQWSRTRASVFYIATQESVSVWDLLVSDIKPWKKVPVQNLQGLAIYPSSFKEFIIILANNELSISLLAGDIQPLPEDDYKRLQRYIQLLCS